MKILKLTFKNLNSLYGEWSVDFTHPEYVSNGIFALTGPTGAGKSTILDAITLALYGQTPRLGRITSSTNEIMSRQTTECSSEVEFTSSLGHFRVSWAQHKARGKLDGNLVDATHEISDVTTQELIESKRSLVPAIVEDKTGMDFDRFTRSVLLAQGSFDSFLKAGAEEKSKILEQITGTEIYTSISKAVFEKHKSEHEILTLLKAQLEEITPLSEEQEHEYREQITIYETQEKKSKETLVSYNVALNWLHTIKKLEDELELYHQQQKNIEIELTEATPKRKILSAALKAQELASIYGELTQLRETVISNKKYLKDTQHTIKNLITQKEEHATELTKKESNTKQAKEKEKSERNVIKKVRSLDQTIASQLPTITSLTRTRDTIKTAIDQTSLEIESKKITLLKKRNRLEEIKQFLQEHAKDALLTTSLSGIETLLETLTDYRTKIGNKESDSFSLDDTITAQTTHIESLKESSSGQENAFKKLQDSIQTQHNELTSLLNGKLLREYYADRDRLKEIKSLQTKIHDLAQERSLLIDGTACPLCGSLDHPYAKGNIPLKDDIDISIENVTRRITSIETIQDHIKELEGEEKREQQRLQEHLDTIKKASNTLDNHFNQRKELDKAIRELKEEQTTKKELLDDKCREVGIEGAQELEEKTLLKNLKKRVRTYNTYIDDRNAITNEIENIIHSIEKDEQSNTTGNMRLEEVKEEITALESEYTTNKTTRYELFQDKDCDTQEKLLFDAIESAESEEKEVKDLLTSITTNLHTLNTSVTTVSEKLEKDEPALSLKESSFIEDLTSFSFIDEEDFISCRLSLPQREDLQNKFKSLDERNTTIKANIQSRTTSLQIERDKQVTHESTEELLDKVETLNKELKTIVEEKATIATTLTHNDKIKKRGQEKQDEINKISKVVASWSRLNNLIGSADGKKYRKFAQGITFELMVDHANKQLHSMSDRYLLLHKSSEPLELHIIDNYQAGEVRSIKNLSGGESFIVSLALALGLSQMSSKKVQVDSLFLDEGFGTLDEQSLDIALETLSSLQQTGKIIGIISHVAGLKERISTQIQVIPINGGKSEIIGPGCMKTIGTK